MLPDQLGNLCKTFGDQNPCPLEGSNLAPGAAPVPLDHHRRVTEANAGHLVGEAAGHEGDNRLHPRRGLNIFGQILLGASPGLTEDHGSPGLGVSLKKGNQVGEGPFRIAEFSRQFAGTDHELWLAEYEACVRRWESWFDVDRGPFTLASQDALSGWHDPYQLDETNELPF